LPQLQLPLEQPPELQAPPEQLQFTPSQGLQAPQLLAEPVRPQPQLPQSATGPS
jgi:hypothetical protein